MIFVLGCIGYIRGFCFSVDKIPILKDITMRIAYRTLCRENCTFSFKEKI